MEVFTPDLYERECIYYRDKIRDISIEYEKNITQDFSSDLSGMDYAFAIMIGVCGAVISNSKNVEKILDEIHQIASTPQKKSDKVFEKIIKKLLGHYQTNIDTLPIGPDGKRIFPTRHADAGRSGPHRIFWGHDILSFKKDNPFVLMIKQTGSVPQGVLSALKHLTADTFSKQGLPIPTSSWWDYSYNNGKKVGNKLLDFCNKLYDESKYNISKTGGNNEIFNHMFSIHAQDITAQALGSMLCKRYMEYMKINDSVIKHQFLLISYAVMFYLNSFLGFARTGILYINWSVGICMIKEFILMNTFSQRDIKKLEKMVDETLKHTDDVEKMVRCQLDSYQECVPISLADKMRKYLLRGEE